MRSTISDAVLYRLAQQNRRVLSDWRTLVLWRQASLELRASERRWRDLPLSLQDVYPVLRRMEERGEIRALPRLRHLYEVTLPYAPTGQVDENEILMEAHPYASLSHITAMAFHQLTDEFPRHIVMSSPLRGPGGLLPIGTNELDWEGLPLPQASAPKAIRNVTVTWVGMSRSRYFGAREYHPYMYPVRITTLERTLADGLVRPELCGGFQNVLKGWVRAVDTVNLDELFHTVVQFRVNVLRQRAGFILSELGVQHPTLEVWRSQAKRGGSSKLVGSDSYSPMYSERWNLSINAPIDVLRGETP